ncbi:MULTISPECIES: acyl-CoA desaturase [unclassified Roseateles]|uniref:DesA family fatty acid desaturase n=1 Tax=unclassified Roseateles TaxID=2626991 RepID=UPI0006FFBFF4|nr:MULTISPECIES: fatty acid desaturase [unclassified Roseateles]KQW41209.1 aminotransferase [Pelomonas sp. Root405]KRA67981.1 aminotransferase [Pelomonas sp. Root662]
MNEILNGLVNWLSDGLIGASGWQVLAFTLVVTHITISAVTIFLHRAQSHRALELGPIPSHFFRFWLWLTTGMVTKEFVAIHRKHHAKCETEEDPHSPQTRGLKALLLTGVELYRAESRNEETMRKYGLGTPDDWIERNLYTRFSWQGVALMLILDLLMFGAIGATVWAIQMAWIPVWATGVINGIGHYWGYRNFEAPDASTNVVPWGILIGGEELHNNHHTYPTSAKFSVKKFEFDIGWGYIRAMEMIGWAKVRKTAPKLSLGEIKPAADARTLEALIANRYEVMASYARSLKAACAAELAKVKADGGRHSERFTQFKLAKRWLHRDEDRIPAEVHGDLAHVRAASPVIDKLVTMREELRQLWTRTNVSADQLVADLQAWCRRAEESGIAELQAFSMRLRAAHV